MYSLKINIIGCDQQILPSAARDILHRWAIMDVDYPSLASAIEQLVAIENERHLFIANVGSAQEVEDLRRLSRDFAGCPILAIVDAENDSALVVKSIRAGATQVIQRPVDPDDLSEALDCIKAQDGSLSHLANLIAITGSVGGCGGTMIAINTTEALARLQRTPCILMELALRKGVLANHLNISPRYTTADLVADIERLDSFILRGAITEIADNFSVLAGPYATIEPGAAETDTVMRLVALARHLARWLVLDVPCTYDELFFKSLMAADHIVLVVDQTVAAIRGAQLVCDGIGQRRPLVVINRYSAKIQGLTIDRIQRALPTSQICCVGYHADVAASMNDGRPIRSHSPRNPLLPELQDIAHRIAPTEFGERIKPNQPRFFGRLVRALSLS